MENVRTVSLPGQVWGLAAPGPRGPVFVACHDGRDPAALTVLLALGLDGGELWRRAYDGYPAPPRVGPDGTVWVAHRGPGGAMLTGFDAGGATVREVVLDHEPNDHLGAFVVLADGFCVSWIVAERFLYLLAGKRALVARHDADGARRWTSATFRAQAGGGRSSVSDIDIVVDIDEAEGRGAADAAADPDHAHHPDRPDHASDDSRRPRSIAAHHWSPLLVAGDRAAATFADTGSGIAVTFFLDLGAGALVAATRPGPVHHKAIAGPGEFLIGYQGYGAFETARHDAAGTVTQEWKTHVMPLIDADGAVSGPESQNASPSRSGFVRLEPDGTVVTGPGLSGYYTSYPALDSEGTAVFWRDGALRAVDRDLTMRDLFALDDERVSASRILLLDEGRVLFALDDEVFILEDTGLGALNTGVWPCGSGGLHGNPVLDA